MTRKARIAVNRPVIRGNVRWAGSSGQGREALAAALSSAARAAPLETVSASVTASPATNAERQRRGATVAVVGRS